MFWFATWCPASGLMIKRFARPEEVWEWIHEFKSTFGEWPPQLVIYKAECIADLS